MIPFNLSLLECNYTGCIFGEQYQPYLYMIWRAVQAVTVLTKQNQADQLKVIDHVGFVLISLFDGFAIVSALDLQAPGKKPLFVC
jgi:hypothetical protein